MPSKRIFGGEAMAGKSRKGPRGTLPALVGFISLMSLQISGLWTLRSLEALI